jgi:hypothetical protein
VNVNVDSQPKNEHQKTNDYHTNDYGDKSEQLLSSRVYLLKSFHDRRDTLAAADARSRQSVPQIISSQLIQNRNHQPRSGCR